MHDQNPTASYQEKYKIDGIIRILREENIFNRNTEQFEGIGPSLNNTLPGYDGNYISVGGKTILAMAGPSGPEDLNAFINVFYNSERSIKTVVVLGKHETGGNTYYCSYFRREFVIDYPDFDVTKTIASFRPPASCMEAKINYETDCVSTDFKVRHRFNARELTLNIFSLPIGNGGSIISGETENQRGLHFERNMRHVNHLLEVYKKWLAEEIIAVHCEQGVRRTAHLVITFALLLQFDQIFVANDPVASARNISKLHKSISAQRQNCSPDQHQFFNSIQLAFMLKVALEKSLTTNNQIMPEKKLAEQIEKLSLWPIRPKTPAPDSSHSPVDAHIGSPRNHGQ